MNKKKILFICKYNRFRSKVAEAFFKKFNKNKSYVASSAGLTPGSYPLDSAQVRVARKFGLHLKGKPRAITKNLLSQQNIVIIVADNVPAKVLDNKKYGRTEYVWKIKDSIFNDDKETEEAISKIQKKILNFVETLR